MRRVLPQAAIGDEPVTLRPPPLRIVGHRSLGDVVIDGQAIGREEFSRMVAQRLKDHAALKDTDRTVYPDGTEQTIGHRDGLTVLEVGCEVLALDEVQLGELCGDLLLTALRAGATDWRIRAAHSHLRDIHDDPFA